jgi:hypothetical protein
MSTSVEVLEASVNVIDTLVNGLVVILVIVTEFIVIGPVAAAVDIL